MKVRSIILEVDNVWRDVYRKLSTYRMKRLAQFFYKRREVLLVVRGNVFKVNVDSIQMTLFHSVCHGLHQRAR